MPWIVQIHIIHISIEWHRQVSRSVKSTHYRQLDRAKCTDRTFHRIHFGLVLWWVGLEWFQWMILIDVLVNETCFKQQSGSGLLDSSDMFNERHLQYHGLMQPAYASSSLPSSQGVLYRDYYSHPVNDFNEQYNRLQQARKQQQMKTQSEALHKQQQTFALRQKLNPPLSRQASAMNLNQSHISTQTTSSVQCSPTLNQPTSSMVKLKKWIKTYLETN